MRPRIDGPDDEAEGELKELVEEYAAENGLQKDRAYYELLRDGVQCEQAGHEELLDKKVPGWKDEVGVANGGE